jgi:hypothetical protein
MELLSKVEGLFVIIADFHEQQWQQGRGESGRTSMEWPTIRLLDVKTHLSSFLEIFHQLFAQRIALDPYEWPMVVYAICIFSMAKSLLIDTLSLRDGQGISSPWKPSDAVQINAVYKVLVSTFIWSSKISDWCPKSQLKSLDPLLVDWASNGAQNGVAERNSSAILLLKEAQNLAGAVSWGSSVVKSTKDFLMQLGTGQNGFLIQRYGFERVQKAPGNRHLGPISTSERLGEISGSMDPEHQVEPAISSTHAATPYMEGTALGAESNPDLISSRSSNIPESSKSFPRYNWNNPEVRMVELHKVGHSISSIVNSIIGEFFSGGEG